jgi:hypothetical protein
MQSRLTTSALAAALWLAPPALAADPAPVPEPLSVYPSEVPPTPEPDPNAPDEPEELPDAPEAEPEAPAAPEEPEAPRAPRRRRFEVELGSEPTWLSTSRMGRVTSSRAAATGSLRASYRLDDRWALTAGFRGGGDLFADTGVWQAETRFQGLLAGVRVSEPLGHGFEVAAELEAEILDVQTTFDLDDASGSGGGPAFGLTPRVGLGATVPLGHVVALRMRLLAGYALRTAVPLDDVAIALPGASESASRDLGALDLSGFQLAIHLGLAF